MDARAAPCCGPPTRHDIGEGCRGAVHQEQRRGKPSSKSRLESCPGTASSVRDVGSEKGATGPAPAAMREVSLSGFGWMS